MPQKCHKNATKMPQNATKKVNICPKNQELILTKMWILGGFREDFCGFLWHNIILYIEILDNYFFKFPLLFK